MPELLEVESYRQIAEAALKRTIALVHADDDWYLKKGLNKQQITRALKGSEFLATRRIGKLLLLEMAEHVVGLRFGMAGTLIVDEADGEVELVYRNRDTKPEWDRFAVTFEDGGRMRMNDPRRLGGVELDPNESVLGVDAADIKTPLLGGVLEKSRVALKSRLMDQAHIAGVGNLIADETLWRGGLDPARPANSLDDDELKELGKQLRATVKQLTKRGGSHTGDLFEHRVRGGHCPKDGTELERRTIGGRTTYSCPQHQL